MKYENLDETVEIASENLAEGGTIKNIFSEVIQLNSRKNAILAFKDITVDDRRILEELNDKIIALRGEAREGLFLTIDKNGGAYSASLDKDFSPEETKGIVEKVLVGTLDIKKVPRSPILGTTENLRQEVAALLEIEKL